MAQLYWGCLRRSSSKPRAWCNLALRLCLEVIQYHRSRRCRPRLLHSRRFFTLIHLHSAALSAIVLFSRLSRLALSRRGAGGRDVGHFDVVCSFAILEEGEKIIRTHVVKMGGGEMTAPYKRVQKMMSVQRSGAKISVIGATCATLLVR